MEILQDIRFGLRKLSKGWGLTLAALLALALGIGANTAIFSVADAVLLRPLAYPDTERLVLVWTHFDKLELSDFYLSPPEVEDIEQQITGFEDTAAVVASNVNLTGDGEPLQIRAGFASAELFPLLGAGTATGRTFVPAENLAGSAPAVVLTHGLWQRRFGGDPDIVGTAIQLDGEPTEVVGVLERDFDFVRPDDQFGEVEMWLSIGQTIDAPRGAHFLRLIGRLKDDVTLEQLQHELSGLALRLEEEYPVNYKGTEWGLTPVSYQDYVVREVRAGVVLLLAIVGVVLLIACTNVANLLIVRATRRNKEVALRKALGARGGRIVRQLMIESLILAGAGGALGTGVAYMLVELLKSYGPAELTLLQQADLDGRALLFMLGLSLFTGLLFGLAPALHAVRSPLSEILKLEAGSSTLSRGARVVQASLVVLQVALAVTVLVTGTLVVQSLIRLQNVDPGFSAPDVFTARVILPRADYPEPEQHRDFFARLVEELEQRPEVEMVGAVSRLPLSDTHESGTVRAEAPEAEDGYRSFDADTRTITPDYFRTLGISLLAGRQFDGRDRPDTTPVAIVDELFAETAWPGENPIGKRLYMPPEGEWTEVVGMVRHVRHYELATDGGEQVYFPNTQAPNRSMFVAVKGQGDGDGLGAVMREGIREIDPNLPLASAQTMDTWVMEATSRQRFNALLVVILATFGLLLALIGIYGVTAYGVSQRQRELGIRLAMGAKGGVLLRLVMVQTMKSVLLGVALGLVVAFFAARTLSSLLFGVEAGDPLTFLGTTVIVVLVAAMATFFPARSVTRTDPMVALQPK